MKREKAFAFKALRRVLKEEGHKLTVEQASGFIYVNEYIRNAMFMEIEKVEKHSYLWWLGRVVDYLHLKSLGFIK